MIDFIMGMFLGVLLVSIMWGLSYNSNEYNTCIEKGGIYTSYGCFKSDALIK